MRTEDLNKWADKDIKLQQVAIELLERALQEDPSFASAHLLLGYAYYNSGDGTKGRSEFQRAFALADSVTDRERFFILASYYEANVHDLDKSVAAYAPCCASILITIGA